MRSIKHYEYACDNCDHRSIVLETTGRVKFKDVIKKALSLGWKYYPPDRLICPNCIELETEEPLYEDEYVETKFRTKPLLMLVVLICITTLAVVWTNRQYSQKEQIVNTELYSEILEEQVVIHPELSERIELDPEEFLSRQEAIPEDEAALPNTQELASLPAKNESEIAKQLKTQIEQQDAESPKVFETPPQPSPVEEKPPEIIVAPKPVEQKIVTEKKPKEEQETKEQKKGKTEGPAFHGKYAIYSGIISANLNQTAKAIGLRFSHVKKLISIFSYNINFRRLAKGDNFIVVFDKEDLEKNGAAAKILAAEFKNRSKTYQRFYFTKLNGKSAYYLLSSKGPSSTTTRIEGGSKDGFLRYPIAKVRVSSHFNLKRRHPISRKVQPHKGTDFAAHRGTKVWSTANGTVSFAGWQRGYGKVVIINHQGKKYTTVYAHLSRIARGIRKGKRVKQKQVVGYVGSTGASTGNHLHYEFKVRGHAVNPLRVKLPKPGRVVKVKMTNPKEKKLFKETSSKMAAVLKNTRLNIGSI